MPVAKGPSVSLRSALIVGVSAIVAGALLVLFVIWASNTGEGFNLGDDEFNAGGVEPISAEIADRGPILYQNPDSAGPVRPIWLSHLGNDPEEGWFAFEAVIPGADADCLAQWDTERSRFVSTCDPSETWPIDGAGLTQITVTVEDGEIFVDLRGIRAADTSSATTTP